MEPGDRAPPSRSASWQTARNRKLGQQCAVAYPAIRAALSQLVTESRQHPDLIFDEALHLQDEVLEELRLITNYRMDSESRLCLLLVGLTELQLSTERRTPGWICPHDLLRTMTFTAALSAGRIDAPFVQDGPVNGDAFRVQVECFLVPTQLAPKDVAVMDNLSCHKGRFVRRANANSNNTGT